ncbi:MAG: DHHA1 domain-containing protein, partial [Melioribacteraceae bacterium]|nr:DHHA1 domain-containing protein [Melioribacteraceae bacterium]
LNSIIVVAFHADLEVSQLKHFFPLFFVEYLIRNGYSVNPVVYIGALRDIGRGYHRGDIRERISEAHKFFQGIFSPHTKVVIVEDRLEIQRDVYSILRILEFEKSLQEILRQINTKEKLDEIKEIKLRDKQYTLSDFEKELLKIYLFNRNKLNTEIKRYPYVSWGLESLGHLGTSYNIFDKSNAGLSVLKRMICADQGIEYPATIVLPDPVAISGSLMRYLHSRDLNPEERKKLSSALADYLLDQGLHLEVENLIGTIYVLIKEDDRTPLRDAREFAVLLNSTGRMDRPSLGIAICMGDRDTSLKEANQILEEYRKSINKYLTWVKEKPERMKEFENIYVIYGDNFINEKIIGTISSILVSSLNHLDKPIIAFANVVEENVAKFSARTTALALRKGINLGEVMKAASEKFDGKGGGHDIAAGAQVPIDQVTNFISLVNSYVEKQLIGEKLGSKNRT